MKESSFDAFHADVSPEDGEAFLREHTGMLRQAGGEKMENEIEMSERQKQVCAVVNGATNELRAKFGLPPFDFPLSNIHVFSKLRDDSREIGGISHPARQQMLLSADPNSIINFARNACHEMIHLKSHGAMKYLPDEQRLDYEYRHGLMIRSKEGKGHYFRVLEEALTEMLTKEIIERLKAEGVFLDETTRMEQILDEFKDKTDYPHYDRLYSGELLAVRDAVSEDGLPPEKPIVGYVYAYEGYRKAFDVLVDKLFLRAGDRFESRQDIVNMFMRAKLEGSMLSVGRLVDETFGVGTFRKIGELSTSNSDVEFSAFIDSL